MLKSESAKGANEWNMRRARCRPHRRESSHVNNGWSGHNVHCAEHKPQDNGTELKAYSIRSTYGADQCTVIRIPERLLVES